MIYIETNNEHRVVFTHNCPFDVKYGMDKSKEELENDGYLVDSIPEPEDRKGYSSQLHYDGESFWYEYEPMPLSSEQKIELLEENTLTALIALAEKHEETLQLKKMNEKLQEMNLIALQGVAELNGEVQKLKKEMEASAD